MTISQRHLEAVLLLSGAKRYEHFIKQIADREEAWGLYADGWAMAATVEGQRVFPLWPSREYAALCARDAWKGYQEERIPLDDLVHELLPSLAEDGILPGVFYTPTDKGVTPTVEQLQADLDDELRKYQCGGG